MASYQVAIDYWPATSHASGVGRYVRELVRALCALEDGPNLLLLDVGPGERVFEGDALGLARAGERVHRFHAQVPRSALALARRATGGHLALERQPIALCLRVFPDQPPECAAWNVLALAELPGAGSQEAARLAHKLSQRTDVFVFSQAARAAAIERLAVARERIHVLPVGCEHWAREVTAPAGDPPTIVVLGRADRGRAAVEILHAFEALRRRGKSARLCFLGRRGDAGHAWTQGLENSPFRADITWHQAPSEPHIAGAVASAALLVHLSREEWTAVTPLEGLAAGLALVVSPLPAFQESLAGFAHYVGDWETQALAIALEAALADAADPAARARRRAHASQFTWARQARLTLDAWRRILERENLLFR